MNLPETHLLLSAALLLNFSIYTPHPTTLKKESLVPIETSFDVTTYRGPASLSRVNSRSISGESHENGEFERKITETLSCYQEGMDILESSPKISTGPNRIGSFRMASEYFDSRNSKKYRNARFNGIAEINLDDTNRLLAFSNSGSPHIYFVQMDSATNPVSMVKAGKVKKVSDSESPKKKGLRVRFENSDDSSWHESLTKNDFVIKLNRRKEFLPSVHPFLVFKEIEPSTNQEMGTNENVLSPETLSRDQLLDFSDNRKLGKQIDKPLTPEDNEELYLALQKAISGRNGIIMQNFFKEKKGTDTNDTIAKEIEEKIAIEDNVNTLMTLCPPDIRSDELNLQFDLAQERFALKNQARFPKGTGVNTTSTRSGLF